MKEYLMGYDITLSGNKDLPIPGALEFCGHKYLIINAKNDTDAFQKAKSFLASVKKPDNVTLDHVGIAAIDHTKEALEFIKPKKKFIKDLTKED